jgi:hypothetical protein
MVIVEVLVIDPLHTCLCLEEDLELCPLLSLEIKETELVKDLLLLSVETAVH